MFRFIKERYMEQKPEINIFCYDLFENIQEKLGLPKKYNGHIVNLVLPINFEKHLKSALLFSDISKLCESGAHVIFVKDFIGISGASSYIISKEDLEVRGRISLEEYTKQLVEWMIAQPISNVITKIKQETNRNKPSAANIPQFSNFRDGTFRCVDILSKAGDWGPSFLELGKYLAEQRKKNVAYIKYGENHAKLANLLDLVYINDKTPRQIFLTCLGKTFLGLTAMDQELLLKRLILRLPIIKEITCSNQMDIKDILGEYLSKTTAVRRTSNIKTLLDFALE